LTDGETIKGPKLEFYYLWDQNKNLKLIKGPNNLLSQKKWYKQRRLVDNKVHKIQHEEEGGV